MITERELLDEFGRVRACIERVLAGSGLKASLGEGSEGDYYMRTHFSGYTQVTIGAHSLAVLRPAIAEKLRLLLRYDFPDWHITVKLVPPDHAADWSVMGLQITSQFVHDQLERQYLPPEFREVEYAHTVGTTTAPRAPRPRGPRPPPPEPRDLRELISNDPNCARTSELWVFSDRRLTSIPAWQAAIDAEGYPLQLLADTPLEQLVGFLPSLWQGQKTGFEVYHDDAGELIRSNPDLDFDHDWKYVLALRYVRRWETEIDAAAAAAGAYARASGGTVMNDTGDGFISPAELRARQDYFDAHDRRYDQNAKVFEQLYERVEETLARFGKPDTLEEPHGDYDTYADFVGSRFLQVAANLEMFRPDTVRTLQLVLKEFLGWQIIMTVSDDRCKDAPGMGAMLRPHEFIDTLQRQYLPPEFRDLDYSGLDGPRTGTVFD